MPRVFRARLAIALLVLLSIPASVPAETPARAVAATVKSRCCLSRGSSPRRVAAEHRRDASERAVGEALGAKWTASNPAWGRRDR